MITASRAPRPVTSPSTTFQGARPPSSQSAPITTTSVEPPVGLRQSVNAVTSGTALTTPGVASAT